MLAHRYWLGFKKESPPTFPPPPAHRRLAGPPFLASMGQPLEDAPELFRFSNPKLVSQKVRTQVILCDAFDFEDQRQISCVLKFFSPNAESAYQRELAVYSSVELSAELQEIVPSKLWSGTWSSTKYRNLLGKHLPTSWLRKSDRQLSVIVLTYIYNTEPISDAPEGLRLFLARAALHSLRRLHAAQIKHGDVSADNLLIQREDGRGYLPFWIDFSSSAVGASQVSILHEWEKAVDYFSDLVSPLFRSL